LFSLTFCVIRFLCGAAAAAKSAGQREIRGGCGQLGHQGFDHVSPVGAAAAHWETAGRGKVWKSGILELCSLECQQNHCRIPLASILCVFVLTFPLG